ncbi:hypothetical protein Q7P36_001534 [Cladosporium allicinum]
MAYKGVADSLAVRHTSPERWPVAYGGTSPICPGTGPARSVTIGAANSSAGEREVGQWALMQLHDEEKALGRQLQLRVREGTTAQLGGHARESQRPARSASWDDLAWLPVARAHPLPLTVHSSCAASIIAAMLAQRRNTAVIARTTPWMHTACCVAREAQARLLCHREYRFEFRLWAPPPRGWLDAIDARRKGWTAADGPGMRVQEWIATSPGSFRLLTMYAPDDGDGGNLLLQVSASM